jgi:N-methylhydantoinase A
MSSSYRLGVDIGGTFTDLMLLEESSGALHMLKTPSVPGAPAQAVIDGIEKLIARERIDPAGIAYFCHGTTLALNTIIQRNGAATGLLVTAGFRDVLELQRLRLPNPHHFYADKPKPLVPRRWVREIDERVTAGGVVLRAPDPEQVRREAARLRDEGVTAIAICFLHAYRYDVAERVAKETIQRHFPDLYVCTSSEIWPQYREYERALVTVMNAYVGDRMRRYFTMLEERLGGQGVRCSILSTKSNGGVMSAASAGERPVQTLLSGPASGVIGSLYVSRLMGQDHIVTLDMGGTSADVAIVSGELPYSTDSKVGEFPVILPTVEVSSIGAGGGSIAWTDASGVLKVGPQSAGADPGPASYGRGGANATVTDAYVTVGIIDPARFLGGTMPLRGDLAREAVRRIGGTLGLDEHEAANSILQVATSNMYAEFLPVLASHGVDPRDFALVPYGGAGPTHAFLLAREVGMRKVIVPPNPGTLCAMGSLVADVRGDFVRTVYADCDELPDDRLASTIHDLEREARDWLEGQGARVDDTVLLRSAEMRYKGQSYEISVPLAGELRTAALVAAFHRRYREVYGYHDERAAVELISLRMTIVGIVPKPVLTRLLHPADADVAVRQRPVYLDGRVWNATVVERRALAPGVPLDGPVIVEQYDTTTFVPPGFRVHVDAYGNLIGEAD